MSEGRGKREIGELGHTIVIEANEKEGLAKRADFKCQKSSWKEFQEPGHSKATGFGVWMVPGRMALERCPVVPGRGVLQLD